MPEPEVIDGRMTETLHDDEAGIATAARLLRAGVLVAFGTETVYGLGADATQADAVAAIFAAKGRPRFNPLICHYDSAEAAFADFVDATGYLTTAETQGYGVASREGMRDWEWERVPHASWRAPFIEEDADARGFLDGDAPVVMVSFYDAVAFCEHFGKRLPTEAEWEYAMRAGSQGTRFPWGDTPTRGGHLALNFWQGDSHEHNLREDGFVYVSPVHTYPPNAWGIYDPVGNVWQWTADWYAPDVYTREAARDGVSDPLVVESGTERVARGGSWWCGACTCEGYGLFYRGKAKPGAVFNNNGFRCAR